MTPATLGTSESANDSDAAATMAAATRSDPGHRGGLVIADRVVEKVAAHAVRRVPHAIGAPRRVLGVTVGDIASNEPARVKADVDGKVAILSLDLTVEWPTPVRAVVDKVRRAVRDDVGRITGVTVQQIDIDVLRLAKPDRDEPRVE